MIVVVGSDIFQQGGLAGVDVMDEVFYIPAAADIHISLDASVYFMVYKHIQDNATLVYDTV